MSLYDVVKDAVKIAQKADNIELTQKLLEVQKQALDMQAEIQGLKEQISDLKRAKSFVFAEECNYLIDPDFPERHLCPICTREKGFESPLSDNGYCVVCKKVFE